MSSNAAASGAEAPKKKSKVMLFIGLGLIVALAGGGGYYYMSMKKAADAELENSAGQGKDKKSGAKVPIFVPLDPFTVNLADTNAEKMAQIAVTLQVNDAKVSEDIKNFMPAIRHNILKAMASKDSKELLTSEGKDKLADEIAIVTAQPLGWTPPDEEAEELEKSTKHGKAEKSKDEKPATEDRPKSKKKKRAAPPPNPIEQVHFSQFIVQ